MDLIDDRLKIPIKRQGYLDMYNGIDVIQTRFYIKLNVKTYIEKIIKPYFCTWMKTSYPSPARSTPLPLAAMWLKKFNAAIGDPDPKAQAKLAKAMKLNYRSGVGELIWAMTTCRPDLAYSSVKLSQSNSCPHEARTTRNSSLPPWNTAFAPPHPTLLSLEQWSLRPRQTTTNTVHSHPRHLPPFMNPVCSPDTSTAIASFSCAKLMTLPLLRLMPTHRTFSWTSSTMWLSR
jgi:hypothetical protein